MSVNTPSNGTQTLVLDTVASNGLDVLKMNNGGTISTASGAAVSVAGLDFSGLGTLTVNAGNLVVGTLGGAGEIVFGNAAHDIIVNASAAVSLNGGEVSILSYAGGASVQTMAFSTGGLFAGQALSGGILSGGSLTIGGAGTTTSGGGAGVTEITGTGGLFQEAGINVQTVTFNNTTAGNFTLTYNGATTAAIPYSTTASTLASAIQTALNNLSTIGSTNGLGNVSVTATTTDETQTITFTSPLTTAATGSFTLTVDGTLVTVNYPGMPTQANMVTAIQNALNAAASPLGAGTTLVAAGANASTITITFIGSLATVNVPQINFNNTGLTGNSVASTTINNPLTTTVTVTFLGALGGAVGTSLSATNVSLSGSTPTIAVAQSQQHGGWRNGEQRYVGVQHRPDVRPGHDGAHRRSTRAGGYGDPRQPGRVQWRLRRQ